MLGLTTALTADNRNVTALDVTFATQDLLGYVSRILDLDAAAPVTDTIGMPLESRLAAFEADARGRVVVYPATALFERFARAVTPNAAWAFEGHITEVVDGFGHVLVDAPLFVSSRTVTTATACDRVAPVTPITDRSTDAVGRLNARAADIGAGADAVVLTFGTLDGADVTVPETRAIGLTDVSTCHEDAEFAVDAATAAEMLLDIETDTMAATDGVLDSASECVRH